MVAGQTVLTDVRVVRLVEVEAYGGLDLARFSVDSCSECGNDPSKQSNGA